MTHLPFENGYALIIGVQEDILAVSDANKLYQILTDPKKAGYPTAQVQLITEGSATKQGILDALQKLKNQVHNKPNATVLLYYSGHGGEFSENDATNYYLIPNDFDGINTSTAISKDEFSSHINAIQAQKMMLIFDCCHANGVKDVEKAIGRIPRLENATAPLVNGLDVGSGRVVMASCKADENSYFDRQKNHGVFTSTLIDALEGKNTAASKTFISFNDICQYLIEQVPIRAFQLSKKPQTPVFNLTDFQGFNVCRNSYVSPKPLVFIISDKRDNAYLEEFRQSLQLLVQRGFIEKWDISQIPPAALVDSYSKQKIKAADIVLCLLSDNYTSSKNNICENLHQLALLENKKIIPILLDDCMYQLYTEFDGLDILPIQQGTNVPDAIINWQNRKSAYLSVGNAILRQVQSMKNS